MGRKQFTTLLIQVRVPQPPGVTQKRVMEWLDFAIKQPTSPFTSFNHQVQLRIVGKDVTYL